MKVAIIVAKAVNNVIGKDNQLIWHLPADLKFFKKTTIGKHILMGRKTYESIGKPLPGRTTIIVTRNKAYTAEGCLVVSSIDEGIALSKERGEVELMIVGGADIYRQAILKADKLYVTELKCSFEGDTFFPEIDSKHWQEIKRILNVKDDKNNYDYDFVEYVTKL